MCGASLLEQEEPEQDEETERAIPGWIGSVAAFILGLIILGGGGYGLYTMLAAGPEPEPTVSVTPSPASTPLPSLTPTDTPVPTPSPTPLPPRAHHVEKGETMSDIAEAYHVTIDEILALNPEAEPELIQTGQVLLVPASTPVAGSSDATDGSDSASQQFVVHVVSPGETLSAIAVEYGVSVSVIQDANDLSPNEETIRAEQSLVIPMNTPTPSPTPTANPDLTPDPSQPYASPPLLYPPDGAVLTDDAPVLLQWASVGVLDDDEWYELSLWGLVRGGASHAVHTRATAWRVPLDLLQRATSTGSTLRWRVRVVEEVREETYKAISEPGAAREFVWRGPVATPSVTTTATP